MQKPQHYHPIYFNRQMMVVKLYSNKLEFTPSIIKLLTYANNVNCIDHEHYNESLSLVLSI